MTTTETRSASDIRFDWVEELMRVISMTIVSHGDVARVPSGFWLRMLERIRTEGPKLGRPDYEGWQRRFRWINLQIGRETNIDRIVLQVLNQLARNV